MWNVEFNDYGRELKISDHFYDHKSPRPVPMSSSTQTLPIPYNSCYNHSLNIFSRNQNLMTDRKETSPEAPVIRSRWNPTAQQLQTLEEIYRRGVRTPSAEQIQQIAAKLHRLGKIEEKNVFYWFQNHKARERQRKRRSLESLSRGKMHGPQKTPAEAKQTGFISRDLEITPSNCSTFSEDSVSMLHKELHQKTWPLDLYSFMPPNKLINAKETSVQENSKQFGALKLSLSLSLPSKNDALINVLENEGKGNLSDLEPFQNWRNHDQNITRVEKKFIPNEFFEFLPLKD